MRRQGDPRPWTGNQVRERRFRGGCVGKRFSKDGAVVDSKNGGKGYFLDVLVHTLNNAHLIVAVCTSSYRIDPSADKLVISPRTATGKRGHHRGHHRVYFYRSRRASKEQPRLLFTTAFQYPGPSRDESTGVAPLPPPTASKRL